MTDPIPMAPIPPRGHGNEIRRALEAANLPTTGPTVNPHVWIDICGDQIAFAEGLLGDAEYDLFEAALEAEGLTYVGERADGGVRILTVGEPETADPLDAVGTGPRGRPPMTPTDPTPIPPGPTTQAIKRALAAAGLPTPRRDGGRSWTDIGGGWVAFSKDILDAAAYTRFADALRAEGHVVVSDDDRPGARVLTVAAAPKLTGPVPPEGGRT